MARVELLQYDVRHDYGEKDKTFIATQLKTHLGERFNVLLSIIEYGIKNGHLVRSGKEEPFIQSIIRGRDAIQALDPREVDFARENAEIIGFQKIDPFLSDPETPIDSKMLSISPEGEQGSKYQHNFYDIFTLKEVRGQRYVELTRYSSGLSRRDYARRLNLGMQDPKAEDFLANPIKAPQNLSPEEISKLLHIEHECMDSLEFEKIIKSAYVQYCMERYGENPTPKAFKAVLNAADEIIYGNKFRDYSTYIPTNADLRYLEDKKVRQAGGQCPGKSGADLDNSPFSVSEFGFSDDKFGSREFECPECGKTNIRPKDELLKNCQHCGSNKVSC
ncbi:MAG: hypothetical protein A3B47_04000 [Candidatus Levybacteria bacterium RIFCSPLOWO2_01_FULL_39_24]|nr:MAG: hypothetical protein A2800_04810 [Candidatus Levybacteria bacterium RIFCSPHIGHO2_01_FULL_40_16]OGH45836.1 MAG: hypothetical protein A3B47_04000 [Candidatus Levybacteria bacterium RIFCSPLOWO2_01_FULL_39_24]